MEKYFLFPASTLPDELFTKRERRLDLEFTQELARKIAGKRSILEVNDRTDRLTVQLHDEHIPALCSAFRRIVGRELKFSEWYI